MAETWRVAARVALALLTTGVVVSGCATNSAEPSKALDSGTASNTTSAAEDGALPPRTPESVFDAGVRAAGDYCSALVAAECDGNEDCAAGQTCCGTLDGGALRYNSIKCQDTCDAAAGGFQICHAGDTCPGASDGGEPDGSAPAPVCRRSLILPQYLAICTTPNALIPNDLVGKPAAAHAVNCGADLTCGAGTKCCVLGNWNAETKSTTTRTGYCAPVADECDCTKAPSSDGG